MIARRDGSILHRPIDWHPQDWIIVAHCLARGLGDEDLDDDRLVALLNGIAADQGLPPPDLLHQEPITRRPS